jgi:hypothetical protein
MTNVGASDILGHFRAALDVMTQYPVMVVPPLAAGALMFVLTVFFLGGAAVAVGLAGGAGLLGAFAAFFVFTLISGLLHLVASAVTILMARDGLAGREPSLGNALGAVMARLTDVVSAAGLVMVIVAIGMMLMVLPGIVAGFFLVFTMPAVLLDGRGVIDALKRSVTLVMENLGAVVGLVIGIILAGIAVMIVTKILGALPLLGHLASAALVGVFVAYLTVVAVRVYQTLPRR